VATLPLWERDLLAHATEDHCPDSSLYESTFVTTIIPADGLRVTSYCDNSSLLKAEEEFHTRDNDSSSWYFKPSSRLQKTKWRSHKPTKTKQLPKSQMTTRHRRNCIQKVVMDARSGHDVPFTIMRRHVVASSITAPPASVFHDFCVRGLATTRDESPPRAVVAGNPRVTTTTPGMHGVDLIAEATNTASASASTSTKTIL
jgi:hypothetical protein